MSGYFTLTTVLSREAFERVRTSDGTPLKMLTKDAEAFRQLAQEDAEAELKKAGATCCFEHRFEEVVDGKEVNRLVSTGKPR